MLGTLNRVAGLAGYPWPVRKAINAAPVGLNFDVEGDLGYNLDCNGSVRVAEGAEVESGCNLQGEVNVRENATVGEGTRIDGDVTVGKYTNLVRDNWVRGDVEIGKYCAIGPRTAIQGTNHDLGHWAMQQQFQRDILGEGHDPITEPITIGHDVWMGRDAIVLPGVEIGNGACIGAGAVVTRDVDPYEVVAGVPAEHLKWRFDRETREKLLYLEWWRWSEDKLREHEDRLEEVVR